jgi:Chlorophyll A-B binding protein
MIQNTLVCERQAAAGWPLSEVWDRQIAEALGLPAILDLQNRVPSILNENMGSVSPTFWGTCLGMSAAIDSYGTAKARQDDPCYFPGNLGFDPLGLYPRDERGRKRMELAEIKHGRISMIAITGCAVQEYVTEIGVVDGTPFSFLPLGNMLQ